MKDSQRLENLTAIQLYLIEKVYEVMFANCLLKYRNVGGFLNDKAFKTHRGKVIHGIFFYRMRG